MKNLFQFTFITLCSLFLLGLNSCQKNDAADITVDSKSVDLKPSSRAVSAVYFIQALDGNSNPVSMKFNVVCNTLLNTVPASGRIFFDTGCGSNMVGVTNYGGPVFCFSKNVTYYIVPSVGPFNKKTLKIKFGTNFNGANLTLLRYNSTSGQWSSNGAPDFTWSTTTVKIPDCD